MALNMRNEVTRAIKDILGKPMTHDIFHVCQRCSRPKQQGGSVLCPECRSDVYLKWVPRHCLAIGDEQGEDNFQ